jgi:toxin CcdB
LRQFDLIPNPSERSRAYAPYFVVLQSHHLENLDTVVVAPAIRDAERKITSLDFEIEFHGEALVVAIGEIFALERSLARSSIGSIAQHEDAVRRGLERLLGGF